MKEHQGQDGSEEKLFFTFLYGQICQSFSSQFVFFASYFQNLFLSQGYKYIPLHVEAFLLPFISLTPVMVNFMSYCF